MGDGLILKEYRLYVGHLPSADAGCEYAGRKFHQTAIDLSPSYRIVIKSFDLNSELVTVLKQGTDVFDVKTVTYGSSGLLQAWSYGDHWVLEIKTDEGVDIIRDGQSLKTARGYDKTLAFQFLNGKPFYFFRKQNLWGINYDNQDVRLNYSDIPYTNVSDGMDPSILQYQNAVLFHPVRNGENYSVIISSFP